RRPALCQQVWDRLVEGAEVGDDAGLGEHLRSCMACYRALTELRDVPRIAAMLRAAEPAGGERDERYWGELAGRSRAAAARAAGAGVGDCVRWCMACSRALTELRDVPRIAAMLRAAEPAGGERDERFWAELAGRSSDAAAAAMGRTVKRRPLRIAAAGLVFAA